jgi:nitrite reductase/ring-hydroxylating ferredoxin subunit
MTSAVVGFSVAGPFGHQWLPVACSADVQGAPAAVRLMGRNLVLWRSPSGAVVAAPELCTHSKGELTKGEVNDGLLVCPKHGWTFGDEGRCVFKPSGLPINDRAHLKVHSCTERYGLVWVSMNEPTTGVMDLSCDGDEGYRRIHTDVSVWRCNSIQIIETLLAQTDSPFVDVTADLPFVVQGALKSGDGAEHRCLVACAPVDSRTSLVTTVLWTGSSAPSDDAKIVEEVVADLSGVKSAAESEAAPTPTVEIASGDEGTGAADWKRRLLAFVGQGAG